jgi:formiminotetrahydrofolate cyclodeaminase
MTLTDRTVSELLAEFRSTNPTPGGGSASALAGAIGASLLAMVAGLPKSRAATAEDVERLAAAVARCTTLAQRLERAVDADARAYETVMAAYRLPKGTDADKAARSAAIQAALIGAIEPPIDVMRAAHAAIVEAAVIAGLGNRSASSDVLVALELLDAGFRGARANAEINLVMLKPDARGEQFRSVLAMLTAAVEGSVTAARARLAEPA